MTTERVVVRAFKIGCWALVLLVVYVVAGSFVHVFRSARVAAEWSLRLKRLGEIGSALNQYETQHHGKLPEKGHWAKSILPLLSDSSLLRGCDDAVGPTSPCGYLFRDEFSGRRIDDLSDQTAWLIEEKPIVPSDRRFKLQVNGSVRRI